MRCRQSRGAWPGLLLAFLLGFAGTPAGAEEAAPRRVLSFNLCADQLLVGLADPGQIVGLSPFSADPEISVVAEQAKPFPRPDQRSEATVALSPDLVLVGPNDRSAMRRVLANLGLRIHEVGLVTDIAAARTQVRELARLLGHPERGDALVVAIDAAQARLAAAAPARGRTALVIERRGYAAGPDSLAAALLRAAGFETPPGAPEGLGGFVPLERLLALNADLLVLHDPVTRAEDQGTLFLTHPALNALYPPAKRLMLPRRFALCGGPALVAALDYMTEAIQARGRAAAGP
ncbi:MAG: ABC transporter substrate-binding protein [Variibacter sp.]|nr:ABC transporter substrate-binding protein [Variibacter sp.]